MKKRYKILIIISALLIAGTVLLRSSFKSFTVTTTSMEKTIPIGAFLIANCWIKKPERNDIIVFYYPVGDTIAIKMPYMSYYQLCRTQGRDRVWTDKKTFGRIVSIETSEKEVYVDRVVGLPGDDLQLKNGQLYINDNKSDDLTTIQYNYLIQTSDMKINERVFENMGISSEDVFYDSRLSVYEIPLIKDNIEIIESMINVTVVTKKIRPDSIGSSFIFPHNENYLWNEDNFGPLYIPKEGAKIELTMTNLPLYSRIISAYEGNELEISESKIIINGSIATSYTFNQDYYFVMGDNRHNSADSRYWGFVPQDHIVGKIVFQL